MTVGQPSDAGASNFKGTGSKPLAYAVTNDRDAAPVATEQAGHGRTGIGGTIPVFSRDWLIAYPSTSPSYSQRVQSFGGRDNHEHEHAGGRQHGD